MQYVRFKNIQENSRYFPWLKIEKKVWNNIYLFFIILYYSYFYIRMFLLMLLLLKSFWSCVFHKCTFCLYQFCSIIAYLSFNNFWENQRGSWEIISPQERALMYTTGKSMPYSQDQNSSFLLICFSSFFHNKTNFCLISHFHKRL